MSFCVNVTGLSDHAIQLSFTCPKGEFPFVYTRANKRLSRCLCIHGSFYRGNKKELCVHARHTVKFLSTECGVEVNP